MTQSFCTFEVLHVPREDNTRADLLARLVSIKGLRFNRMVIQETIETLNFESGEFMALISREGCADRIERYLTQDLFPEDQQEARKIKRRGTHLLMVVDQLYKIGRSTPMLRCLSEEMVGSVMREVHEEACGIHIGGRALCGKILWAGYYWSGISGRVCCRIVIDS